MTTSATISAIAAIRMPVRQNCPTASLALAGLATAKRKAIPPSNNASKDSVAARAWVLNRSISRRNQIKAIVLGCYLI